MPVVTGAKHRVIPLFHPWSPADVAQGHFSEPFLRGYLEPRGPFWGVGEFCFYCPDMQTVTFESPVMQTVFRLANEMKGIVYVHPSSRGARQVARQMQVAELEPSIRKYPDVIFLFHGGPPDFDLVAPLMSRYPNVYFTLDVGVWVFTGEWTDWVFLISSPGSDSSDHFLAQVNRIGVDRILELSVRRALPLLQRYPDRIMWGTDRSDSWNFEDAATDLIIQVTRQFIARLPIEMQEDYAYRTAQRVFGRYLTPGGPTPAVPPTPAPAPIATSGPLRLFDAHTHLSGARIGGLTLDQYVQHYRDAGFSGMVLLGAVRETMPTFLRLQSLNPGFVFPFVDVGRDPQTKQLRLTEEVVRFIEEQLDTGQVFGIGELSLRHAPASYTPPEGDDVPADHPIALRLYDLAARKGVPINMHNHVRTASQRAELERALAHNRNAKIILAHALDRADALRELMSNHPNLYADLSARDPIQFPQLMQTVYQGWVTPDGALSPEWRSLLEDFPDRFLFGLDLGNPVTISFDQVFNGTIQFHTSVLRQLRPATAEKIAHGNIKRLLGLQD